MNEEHDDKQLHAAYRRASADDAGRPDARRRAAILAEAAAAARRRTPAANESRYLMRAVATVAVIGVGLLVWRQTDHRLPGEAPPLDEPLIQEATGPAADQAFVPDPAAPAAPPAGREPAAVAPQTSVPEEPAQKSEAAPAPLSAESPPPPPSPATSPLPAPEARESAPLPDEAGQDELQEVQVTGSRVLAPRRTVGPRDNVPAPSAGAAVSAADSPIRAEPTAADLLREYFPAQNQSATPRRVWLVRDEAGVVLDVGELGPREQLAPQISSIRRALNLRELVPGPVQSVPNARGQLIELNLLEAR